MKWGSIEVALGAERKCEMRRFMVAVVAVGVVFAAGVSYAQESGAPTMPEKVRGFLDNLTGTWKVDDEEGISKEEIRWDSGKGALIENGQFQGWGAFATWTGLWYWDGISEDGVILCVSVSTSHGFAHGELRGKVLSKTVMEGQGTGVRAGKKRSGNIRIEFKGPDQYTVSQTNIIAGGEKKPDSTTVSTRVKTTSAEQELTELYRVWLNAAVKNDAATIGHLLADDFICGVPNGEILTKAPYLAEITSGDYQVTSMREDALKVRIYGDMALVTCIWTEKSQSKGADASGQYCSTDTWIKRDGRWQCVAEHISKVAETTNDNGEAIKTHSLWQGTYHQVGYEEPYPMVLFISSRTGDAFEGMTSYPTLGYSLITISGEIKPDGVITFTEEEVIYQGSYVEGHYVVSGCIYTGSLKGNTLKGLATLEDRKTGDFVLKLAD